MILFLPGVADVPPMSWVKNCPKNTKRWFIPFVNFWPTTGGETVKLIVLTLLIEKIKNHANLNYLIK